MTVDYTHEPIRALLTAVLAIVAEFYAHLAPWLLLGLVLCLCDLRYGIMAARTRGEVIRTSRMWRRTINKMIDYLCWVTVAEVLSRTFAPALGAPVVSMAVLFIVYAIELSSCINNYFEYKGVRKRFNVWRFFAGRRELDALEDVDAPPEKEERPTD